MNPLPFRRNYISDDTIDRAAKRGIWKGGALKETPAEYKRKYAKDADVAERAGPSSAAASDKDQGILKGLKKFLNPNTK